MGQNELLEQILSVTEFLVSYGLFETEIIETLLCIMDGKTDRPSKSKH